MPSFFSQIRESWANWTGDSEMDSAIRRGLSTAGYFGNTAKIRNFRLVAVQRPGWLQVFRFEATARLRLQIIEDAPDPPAEYVDLFGLIREDVRKNDTMVRFYQNADERTEMFARWSEDLIVLRGGKSMLERTS